MSTKQMSTGQRQIFVVAIIGVPVLGSLKMLMDSGGLVETTVLTVIIAVLVTVCIWRLIALQKSKSVEAEEN